MKLKLNNNYNKETIFSKRHNNILTKINISPNYTRRNRYTRTRRIQYNSAKNNNYYLKKKTFHKVNSPPINIKQKIIGTLMKTINRNSNSSLNSLNSANFIYHIYDQGIDMVDEKTKTIRELKSSKNLNRNLLLNISYKMDGDNNEILNTLRRVNFEKPLFNSQFGAPNYINYYSYGSPISDFKKNTNNSSTISRKINYDNECSVLGVKGGGSQGVMSFLGGLNEKNGGTRNKKKISNLGINNKMVGSDQSHIEMGDNKLNSAKKEWSCFSILIGNRDTKNNNINSDLFNNNLQKYHQNFQHKIHIQKIINSNNFSPISEKIGLNFASLPIKNIINNHKKDLLLSPFKNKNRENCLIRSKSAIKYRRNINIKSSLQTFYDKYEKEKKNFNCLLFNDTVHEKKKDFQLESFLKKLSDKHYIEKLYSAREQAI